MFELAAEERPNRRRQGCRHSHIGEGAHRALGSHQIANDGARQHAAGGRREPFDEAAERQRVDRRGKRAEQRCDREYRERSQKHRPAPPLIA